MMRIDRAMIKGLAREDMRTARPRVLLVSLVFVLLTSGIQEVISLVFPTGIDISKEELMTLMTRYADAPDQVLRYLAGRVQFPLAAIFLGILVALFITVVNFGYMRYCLNVSRGMEAGYGDLIGGFAYTGRVLGMQVMIFLFILLWTMAIVVPGTIIIVLLAAFLGDSGVGIFLMIALYLLMIVAVFAICLRYALADLALADDPELGAMGAIRRSKELMVGRCGEYVVLMLSFLGWELLLGLIAGAVTGVIGALHIPGTIATFVGAVVSLPMTVWLTSYVNLTCARFFLGAVEMAGGTPYSPETL